MFTAKVKRMLIGIAAMLALILGIVAVVRIGKIEKTKELGLTSFEIGALAAADGKETKSDYAIRSKMQKADKFNKITLAEGADVTYAIYYFNADKKFIGKSNALSAETTELETKFTVDSATENVRYYRVVVLVPDTKDEVTLLNMNNYLKQITVTVNK